METMQGFHKKLGFVTDSFFDTVTVYSPHFQKTHLQHDRKDKPKNAMFCDWSIVV